MNYWKIFPQYLIKYFNIQYHKWIIEQFSTIFDQALLETVSALQMLLNIFIFPPKNHLFRHGVQIRDKQTAPQWHISCNCHLFASLSLKIRYLPCMALYGFVCYSAKTASGVLGGTSNPAMIYCQSLRAANQCNVSKSNHYYIHVLEQWNY